MSSFANRLAGLATLALAALPIAALTTAAHAAPYRLPVADLNLASPAGAAKFESRVRMAVNAFCADQRQIGVRSSCQAAVRSEIHDKLGPVQQARLAGAMSLAAR